MVKNGRLLIVDDETEIRQVLRHSLTDFVEMVFEAESGKEALEKLETLKVQAIISDISMPGMTGIELLTEIRKRGSQIPFIILTGFADKKTAIEALRLGAFDFLEKPWTEIQIIEIVGKALLAGQKMGF